MPTLIQTNRKKRTKRSARLRHNERATLIAPAPKIEAAGAGEGGQRSFKGLAYTGAVVMQWYGALIIDLDGIELPAKSIPVFMNHSRRVGYSTRFRRTSRGVEIEGVLLSENADAEAIARDADQGYPWELSIRPEFDGEMLLEGESATVNGHKVEGPILIARKTQLRETSFVELGADANTEVAMLAKLNGINPTRRPLHRSARLVEIDTDKMTVATLIDRRPDLVTAILRVGVRTVLDQVESIDLDEDRLIIDAFESLADTEKEASSRKSTASAKARLARKPASNGSLAKRGATKKVNPAISMDAATAWGQSAALRLAFDGNRRRFDLICKRATQLGKPWPEVACVNLAELAKADSAPAPDPETEWERNAELRANWTREQRSGSEELARKAYLMWASMQMRHGEPWRD